MLARQVLGRKAVAKVIQISARRLIIRLTRHKGSTGQRDTADTAYSKWLMKQFDLKIFN